MTRAGPDSDRRLRAVAPRPLECQLDDFRLHSFRAALRNVTVMFQLTQTISILSEGECWNLLRSVALGRLVTVVDGQLEIFPVNFVVQRRTVLFRTAEGTKLVSAVINDNVLFEADDHEAAEGWSVIVKGMAQTLRTHDEIDDAEQAQLIPWTATLKPHYVRIRPLSLTGRRFSFGPEPEDESTAS